MIDAAVEAYVDAHTTAAPPELAELEEEARRALPFPSMLSGHVVGRFLETLVAIQRPQLVVEVGTYAGLSALWMARTLPPGGRIVTLEIEKAHAEFAQRWFDRVEGGDRIELRLGPAIDALRALDGPFDLVFIDAEKTGYPAYLDAALEKLSPHGLVVADNTLREGRVLDPESESEHAMAAFNDRVCRDASLAAVQLTVRDGLSLIRRA